MAYNFVIIGTRCNGSKEVARLLTDAGLTCNRLREKHLTFETALYARDGTYSPMFARHSFYAGKYVRDRIIYDSVVSDETIVLHLIRNPVSVILDLCKCIDSISYTERVVLLHLGIDLEKYTELVDRAAAYYIGWFWLAEEAFKQANMRGRWRFEHASFENFVELADMFNRDIKYVEIPKRSRGMSGVLQLKDKDLSADLLQIVDYLGYVRC